MTSANKKRAGFRGVACIGVLSCLMAGCGGGGGAGGGGGSGGGGGGGSTTYTVGGSVSGLAGSGLVLQLNGANNLAVSANGAFTLSPALAAGSAYAVTVLTQPSTPVQTCAVANGSGSVASANVTNVAITCTTSTFTIGGTVTGLTGSGLTLRLNGGADLSIPANGSFVFASGVASGAAYAVTVASQPFNPPHRCTVSSGSGTVSAANITNVSVACTPLMFRPATGRLTRTRGLHTATLLADGKILITGGVIDTALTATNTAELYDPVTQTSVELSARMTAVRNQHSATMLANGSVLIVGGSPQGDGDGTNTAELYNPTTQTFTPVTATLQYPRGGHSATRLQNGQVLIAGGFYDGAPNVSAEIYDPAANSFTMLPNPMTIDREGHRGVLLPDGRVLLSAGASGDPETPTATAEVYDPVTRRFSALGVAMNAARAWHSATVLSGGQVLIVGGVIEFQDPNSALTALDTAEVYDPSANAFLAVSARLGTSRGGHAAVALADGTVLILGGVTGANSPLVVLDSIEAYAP